MNKKIIYESKVPIHPGEHLADVLDAQGITQTDLSTRTNLTRKLINDIINGRSPISPETAYQLEPVLGIPNTFWLNLQSNYDMTVKRNLEIQAIKESPDYNVEKQWLNEIDYSELVTLGFVQPTDDKAERIFILRKLARVSSLVCIEETNLKGAARRANVIGNTKADALWRQIALTKANNIELKKYNKKNLLELVKRLRTYSREENIGAAVGKITEELSDCGVSLVLMPHLKNSGFNGYTEKIRNGYMVIVTLRNKSLDGFWFSLLHELSHIIYGHVDNDSNEDHSSQEEEANINARNLLISPHEFETFKEAGDFSQPAVVRFAKDIDVEPCIVRGRLCHEGLVKYTQLLTLKVNLKFVD